jgi:hypothetical protein
MTLETEQRVHELLDKLEKRNSIVLKITTSMIILILTTLIGIGIYIQKANQLRNDVDDIEKNYIPIMFLDGLQKNQYFMTKDLIIQLTGASSENIDKLTCEYREFQKFMIDQMIDIKKAHSGRTRSANTSTYNFNSIH